MHFVINSKRHGVHKVLIDNEDSKKVLSKKWHVLCQHRRGRLKVSSIVSTHKGRNLYLHRFILFGYAKHKTVVVDHIDGDPLNNRKSNLRKCQNGENAMNIPVPKNNILGIKGVRYHSYGQYQARIRAYNKNYHLGLFPTIEDAARAYNEAALKYHGEFARLNII